MFDRPGHTIREHPPNSMGIPLRHSKESLKTPLCNAKRVVLFCCESYKRNDWRKNSSDFHSSMRFVYIGHGGIPMDGKNDPNSEKQRVLIMVMVSTTGKA